MSDTDTNEHLAQLPRAGEVIEGRYLLEKSFASGGMGVVMRAEQVRTGRHVAIKLLDFGIAKLANSQASNITASGMLTGTPAYIAPESVLQIEQANPKAADVYAAGLVLLEMLTGQRAFEGGSVPHTLLAHIKKPLLIPAAIADTPLGDVIRKATCKHPDDRYQDADEMYEALEAVRDTLPADFRLSESELPNSSGVVTPGGYEKLGGEATDSDLEMLREVPNAKAYRPGDVDAAQPLPEQDKDQLLGRVETGAFVPNPSQAKTSPQTSAPRQGGAAGKIAVVLAALVVVLGAVAWWLASSEESTSSSADVSEAQATGEVESNEEPEEAEPAEPEKAEEAEEAAAAEQPAEPAPTIQFELTSQPEGAAIWSGDEEVGTTDATIAVARERLPHTLRLSLEGYEDATVEVTEDAESPLSVELVEKAPEPAPRKPRPVRSEKPASKKTDKEAAQAEDKSSDIDKMVDQYLPGE